MNRRQIFSTITGGAIAATAATVVAQTIDTPEIPQTDQETSTVSSDKVRLMEMAYQLATSRNQKTVYYISVGNLPKMKAEEYMKKVMAQFNQTDVNYNAETGEIRSQPQQIFLPVREGDGYGTRVEIIPGTATKEEVLKIYDELCIA